MWLKDAPVDCDCLAWYEQASFPAAFSQTGTSKRFTHHNDYSMVMDRTEPWLAQLHICSDLVELIHTEHFSYFMTNICDLEEHVGERI